MLDTQKLEALARRLSDALPVNIAPMRAEIQANFRAILENTFAKLHLVTQEEFANQQRVLAETRAKLDRLEKIILRLEQQ